MMHKSCMLVLSMLTMVLFHGPFEKTCIGRIRFCFTTVLTILCFSFDVEKTCFITWTI